MALAATTMSIEMEKCSLIAMTALPVHQVVAIAVGPLIICFTLVSWMCPVQSALAEATGFAAVGSVAANAVGPRSKRRSQAAEASTEYHW